ncbi:MAG: cation diffusion facilitator family transporter [Anaerolineales bacterium]|nr:cation diffusion facilitator family transporter [Anaerolineales bacterium]
MSHSHRHVDTEKNILVAFLLNLGFTLFEIFGAIWTNSLAILSDAVHDLGDSLSLGLAWYLERYSKRGEDVRFSYGYRRFSLLGAFLNTVILISGSILILLRAVPRLLDPEVTNAQGMILFSIVGIVVNGAAVLRLKRGKSLNSRTVAWHLLEDVLGWVALLVVSLVLLFTDLYILDPILSILLTGYILYNTVRNLQQTARVFLQAVPEDVDLDAIDETLVSIDHIRSTHHTHVWSLDGEHHVLTTHVVVDKDTPREDIVCIRQDIHDVVRKWGFSHSTIEIEFGDEDCGMQSP